MVELLKRNERIYSIIRILGIFDFLNNCLCSTMFNNYIQALFKFHFKNLHFFGFLVRGANFFLVFAILSISFPSNKKYGLVLLKKWTKIIEMSHFSWPLSEMVLGIRLILNSRHVLYFGNSIPSTFLLLLMAVHISQFVAKERKWTLKISFAFFCSFLWTENVQQTNISSFF